MRHRRGSTDGMVVRRSSAPRAAQQTALASSSVSSPWQAPGDVLDPILQRLLASEEDGPRWLRVASHVCSAWRSAALDILLADTAISKPPLEDFRAIGAEPAPAQPTLGVKKTDTVVTQAAMVAVAEASASSGMEAISKQRFDAPPAGAAHAAAEGAGGTGRGRASGRAPRRATPRLAYLRQSPIPPDLGAAILAHHAQRQAQQRAQRLLQQAQQQGAGGAATSPARPQAAAQPQGSVQSDMAAVGNRGRAASESESDGGSTLAQAGPAKKRRRRQRGRGAPGTACVEQPPPGVLGAMEHQAQQQQQQQRGIAEATGQPSGTAQGLKRAGSGEEVRPRKRRQASAEQPHRAADEADGPSRLSAGQQGVAADPATAPAEQQQQERRQRRQEASHHERHQHAPQHSNGDSEASGPYYEAEGEVRGEQVGAQQGQRARRRPVSAPAAVGGPPPAAPAASVQRSGASGRVLAVVDFVKRIVGF